MIEDCGKYYRNADNATKRLLNQAIFKKIYVSNAEDDELKIEPQFRAPYDQLLEPIKDDLAKINRTKQTMSDRLQQFIETAKGHIQAIFGCCLNADNNSNFIENTSNQSKFFGQISSSKNILRPDDCADSTHGWPGCRAFPRPTPLVRYELLIIYVMSSR